MRGLEREEDRVRRDNGDVAQSVGHTHLQQRRGGEKTEEEGERERDKGEQMEGTQRCLLLFHPSVLYMSTAIQAIRALYCV